ncbi:MAG: hypothetical protein ACK56F_16835, partial [bacterium]
MVRNSRSARKLSSAKKPMTALRPIQNTRPSKPTIHHHALTRAMRLSMTAFGWPLATAWRITRPTRLA